MTNNHSLTANKGFCAVPNLQTPGANSPRTSQRWMREGLILENLSPVSPNQLTSLSAMIAYIADKTGHSEFRIERDLSDHYGVPNATCLGSENFDSAIRYLADIMAA